MDLGHRRYETSTDLYRYCIRVASAVGLICLEIFGYDDPRARQYATDLGVALQLTNILRDVPGDLAQGRLYIPLDDLGGIGVTEQRPCVRDAARRAGRALAAVKALLRAAGAAGARVLRARRGRPAARGRTPARRRRDHGGDLPAASSTGSKPPTTTCSAASSASHGRSVR